MGEHGAIPVFDGHNDALVRLYQAGGGRVAARGFLERQGRAHLDLARANEGGFGGGFFALIAPDPTLPTDGSDLTSSEHGYEVRLAPPLDPDRARRATMAMAAGLLRIAAASAGRIRVARAVADLESCLGSGVLGAVLHLEGAEPIDPGLDALEVFHAAGLRSLGIVWSRPNAFGHGVPFRFPASPNTGPGLTDAGKALVRACNRLGILVDLSHLNARGFWDVAAHSDAPLVATHSAVHALCPSSRNLTDDQLDAIRGSDGLVGLNFEVSALRADGYDEPDTPLETVVRHVDALVERLGIDRVGFGSDFDGATMPRAIGDASGLPRLLAALRERGYDEASLRKLAAGNWLRVLGRTWHA